MMINNSKDLRTALRNGPYAWLGGYPLYFITHDGEALSFKAVRDEYRLVLRSVREKSNDGWRVIAVDVNYEDQDLYCAHTNEHIQAAYGE